jgi:Flp pilus assembly protein TadD
MAKSALEIKPVDVKGAGLLVQSLVAASRAREAVSAISPVVIANPRSAAAHFWLGQAHEADGDSVRAIEAYRRALAIDPRYVEAARALDGLGR